MLQNHFGGCVNRWILTVVLKNIQDLEKKNNLKNLLFICYIFAPNQQYVAKFYWNNNSFTEIVTRFMQIYLLVTNEVRVIDFLFLQLCWLTARQSRRSQLMVRLRPMRTFKLFKQSHKCFNKQNCPTLLCVCQRNFFSFVFKCYYVRSVLFVAFSNLHIRISLSIFSFTFFQFLFQF